MNCISCIIIVLSAFSVGVTSAQLQLPCRTNEVWTNCTRCETSCGQDTVKCSDACNPPSCFCDPVRGFRRDAEGRCVAEHLCFANDTELCGDNMAFLECGTACPETCADNGQLRPCTKQCVRGCFCQSGYVFDDNGSCVRRENCRSVRNCSENMEFRECGTACPRTCDNKGKPIVCTAQCVKGCFCIDGYVLDGNGKCIPEQFCDLHCGENMEFRECGTACPETCDNIFGIARPCTLQCVAGCFCKQGFVLNKENKCVPREKCFISGETQCGANMEFKECGTACPETCADRGVPKPCTLQCVPGCFCKEGFVLDNNGSCIPRGYCKECGANMEFKECGTACPELCADKGVPKPCTLQCVPGCFCKEGFVLDDNGNCIPRKSCNISYCGANMDFRECGTACPETCSDKGVPKSCSLPCIRGCFCKEGFVLDDDGNCILRESCRTDVCGANMEFKECGGGCPETCADKDVLRPCTLPCTRGCFCKEGFVLDSNGNCIPRESCKATDCGSNMEFKECGTACPETCADKGVPKPCTLQCVPGCFCKEGFVLDDNENCIPRESCRIADCGANMVFKHCGSACPENCADKGIPRACVRKCVAGCFCKEGFVLDNSGNCIMRELCKGARQCGEHMEYQNCATACPKTCANKDMEISCKTQCAAGCACVNGYVLDEYGNCVPEQSCAVSCGENMEYKLCGTACPETCDNIMDETRSCTEQCVAGCFCKRGFVVNKNGKCVRRSSCHKSGGTSCGRNREYRRCGSACPERCADRGVPRTCGEQCIEGCFCKEGYVLNHRWDCVPRSSC